MTDNRPLAVRKYRVHNEGGAFEPQMYCNTGVAGDRWFPLNELGYWLDPDAFSFGIVSKRNFLSSHEDAQRIVDRAMVINGDSDGR